ncbi:hypothetical protein [Pseudoalteromonas sp. L21]|uniref:hypothetical protein n=1 Tax=Pseudoalteromonas sp. L21 TaxID=1539746 RepID=UPI001F256BE9|nr:hypothetical protein [Pseudoalteromonas sp. L21]MCF7519397.1 hypothetical protein [Pseudoalteromonas sp. L21]
MDKTYLKNAAIVSVFDYKDFEKIHLADVLTGSVIEDETLRFRAFQQIVTSKIVTRHIKGEKSEVITHSGSCYVIDDNPEFFELTLAEFVVMRTGAYSPKRIIEMRDILKQLNKNQH